MVGKRRFPTIEQGVLL